MRLPVKKLVVLCTILIFPTFVLKMFRIKPRRIENVEIKPTKSTDNLMVVDQECLVRFRSPKLRKRLSRALVLGDPDVFMSIMRKHLPMCQLKETDYNSYGFGFIEPRVSVTPTIGQENSTTNLTMEDDGWYTNSTLRHLCPRQSPLLKGHIQVDTPEISELRRVNGKYLNWPMTLEELAVSYQSLQLGGFYPGPSGCRCRGFNAIIVPFRDREEHLRYFLYYIHQLLHRQQLCYIVIVSEQDDDHVFNKGQLMNTAFEYARELMSFDCYIFHDVDVIAEDDRILYTCREDKIMHYAPYIDKYDYKFVNGLTVGAAVGFTEEQFLAVNGYSNEYAGWGGEDDDMAARITMKKIPVWRSKANYTKFRMIKHGSDQGNEINRHRYERLKMTRDRQRFDGVNSLDTLLVDNIQYKTHTRLKVKTYQTGLQKEMERSSSTEVHQKNRLDVGIPLAKRNGVAINSVATIWKVKKKT